MDLEGLNLEQVLDIRQLGNLVRRLVACDLTLELLDHEGKVRLPRPAATSPGSRTTSHDGCASKACQRERQALYATVMQKSEACATRCAEHCTLVGVPIRPFSTTLGILMACRAQPLAHTASVKTSEGNSAKTEPDGTDLIELLHTLLDQVITTTMQRSEIDNLAQELLDRYEQLNFVFDLARHINPANDLPSTLDLVTDKIAQLFGPGHVVAIFSQGDVAHLATVENQQPASALADGVRPLCRKVADQVYHSKRTVVRHDRRPHRKGSTPMPQAILATPIPVDNKYYGTLNVLNVGQDRDFVNGDIALVETVGTQVGIFLENHKLYQRLEEFHQSQKMEALGRLAGGIAHDFNNILSAILGFSEMTRDDLPEGSLLRKNLERILKAGHRAKELVQQILAFSRRREQVSKPVHIAPIVTEVLQLQRASLPTEVEIHQDLDLGCGAVLADPTELHQVIMNLCTNAGHAMHEHGGVLDVRLATVEVDADSTPQKGVSPGMYARLTVGDTGCGMPAEVIEHIFDPFFTTKAVGKGTGMGLAMVHGIVKSSGGVITVSSELGKGTTFDILLPRSESDIESEEAEATPIPTGTERVLLIDDEEDLVHMGRQMLERLGYEVMGTTRSLEALEVFRAQPHIFDVVITDQTMPEMTGDELARELLRIRPHLPIILTTGFSHAFGPEQAKEVGIREFLKKPVGARDLGEAIRRVLD